MWRKTSLPALTFVLVATLAGAQAPPAPPKAPVAPVMPLIAPEILQKIEALGVTLDIPAFALAADECIVGFVHIGTAREPSPDRERPDPLSRLSELTL